MRERFLLAFALFFAVSQAAAEHGQIYRKIPAASRFYISDFLISDFIRTQLTFHPLPLILVGQRAAADYVIEGTAREHDPSYARTLILTQSKMYETSIRVVDAKTGQVVMTYSRDKRKAETEAADFTKELERAIR